MGLILAPIFLCSVGLVIANAYQINRLHELELLSNKIFLFGFFITISIYASILFSYFLEGKYYGLSPYFRIPIFMFILPSLIGWIGLNAQDHTIKLICQSLIASTLITAFLVLIFNKYIIDSIDLLGIEKYY